MKTIEEKTDAIITFMHGEYNTNYVFLKAYDYAPLVSFKRDEVKYHSSFDWIYPVIAKIEKLGCKFESFYSDLPKDPYYVAKIHTYQNDLFKDQYFFGNYNEDRAKAFFNVVAEFCAWYNEKFGHTNNRKNP